MHIRTSDTTDHSRMVLFSDRNSRLSLYNAII